MVELGYQRDEKQCREIVKNLRSKYRKVKDDNSKSGHGKAEWKFMEEFDKVLGTRPTTCPTALLDSMSTDEGSMEHADVNDGSCSELGASSPTATVGSSINVVDDNAYANEGEGSAVETACGSSKHTPEETMLPLPAKGKIQEGKFIGKNDD